MTRRVQAFKARYNTYFNAHQAYLEGIEAQRTGNKDNYTEFIPYLVKVIQDQQKRIDALEEKLEEVTTCLQ